MAKLELICLFVGLTVLCSFIECAVVEKIFEYKKDAILVCGSEKNPYNKDKDYTITFFRDVNYPNGTSAKAVPIKYNDPDVKHADYIDLTKENGSLIIKDPRKDQLYANYTCTAQDSTGEFKYSVEFKALIKPILYIPTKASHTIVAGGSTKFECSVLYSTDVEKGTWVWTLTPENTNISHVVKEEDGKFAISSSTGQNSSLTLNPVLHSMRGNFNCTFFAANADLGNSTQMFKLRVKDWKAALWPFLAIVVEVVLLCLIILIYEKKFAKKKSTPEDEGEQAQNLMGRDGQAASDVKKRSPKA